MKNRFITAISATFVAIMLIFTLTLSFEKSNASEQYKNNVKAFSMGGGDEGDDDPFGKCTGPRPQGGNCESSNDHKCSDNSNCSS